LSIARFERDRRATPLGEPPAESGADGAAPDYDDACDVDAIRNLDVE